MWHWQADADRWLFFGTMPTVWLQERLKLPHPPWWEVVISTVYMSFFILPYVVAGVLWLRNRDEWKAFIKLFVGLSFASLVIYALLPAAPPWAAARCTAADVEGGPSGPRCMFRPARGVPDGGLLGAMQTNQDGANGWIERIVGRGWGKLNLHSATALIDQGQASVNLVAAVPSLHAGLTLAIAAFLWNRIHRGWRPLLVAYVLVMAFTLVTPPSTTSSTFCSAGRWRPSFWWSSHASRDGGAGRCGHTRKRPSLPFARRWSGKSGKQVVTSHSCSLL